MNPHIKLVWPFGLSNPDAFAACMKSGLPTRLLIFLLPKLSHPLSGVEGDDL
jgi:hypothetical protein